MASVQRPTVKVGDVIRVHVPPLPDLWRVDAVLIGSGTWGYFIRISQRVDGAKLSRTISPRGFEIVSPVESDLDLIAQVMAELWPALPVASRSHSRTGKGGSQ